MKKLENLRKNWKKKKLNIIKATSSSLGQIIKSLHELTGEYQSAPNRPDTKYIEIT